MIAEQEIDDGPTLFELADSAGMSPEQFEDEVISSVASLGLLIMETDPAAIDGVSFISEDDIGEIEVLIRRIKPEERTTQTLH